MFSRITGYLLLYTISFGFFTAILHTFAFADRDKKSSGETAERAVTGILSKPTPTIYTAPSKSITPSPRKSTATLSEKINELTGASALPPTAAIVKSAPTAVQIILPANTPTPTHAVMPTITQAPVRISENQTASGGMSADRLFEMANAHRRSIGVSELQKDDATCALANARAGEIKAELENGTLHSGMYGRNLPYWNTENAIAMGPEESAFAWWLSDYIHRKAIENPTYTISCTACNGVYCVQEFTSYQPK